MNCDQHSKSMVFRAVEPRERMSDLSSQLSAFRNRIRSGPSVAVRRSVAPRPVTPQTEEAARKRTGEGDFGDREVAVKRQRPGDYGTDSGSHLSTRLHLAVEYIKKQDSPISVNKLEGYLSFDISSRLLPLLKEIDRIRYDPVNNTLEYMSLHNIRTSDDLLNFLRSQPTFKGTSVKELCDGWSGCLEAITKLEEENQILVLRNKKENAPRLVWANVGGEIGTVDEEFVEQWGKIKVPDRDNLYQVLVENSLKPTGSDPHESKKAPQQQEKKQKKARRGKITNTHMKGILKDYSQLA